MTYVETIVKDKSKTDVSTFSGELLPAFLDRELERGKGEPESQRAYTLMLHKGLLNLPSETLKQGWVESEPTSEILRGGQSLSCLNPFSQKP